MSSSISVGMMDTSQLPGMVKRIMRYCVKQSVCEAPLRQSTTRPVSKPVEPVNSPNMDSRPNDWRDETGDERTDGLHARDDADKPTHFVDGAMPVFVAMCAGGHQIAEHVANHRSGKQAVVAHLASVEEHDEHDRIADHADTAAPQHGCERAGAHKGAGDENQRTRMAPIMRDRHAHWGLRRRIGSTVPCPRPRHPVW